MLTVLPPGLQKQNPNPSPIEKMWFGLSCFGGLEGDRPKLRFRPGLGSDMPPACHSLPRPFEAFCSFTQNKHRPNGRCLFWQGKKASNPRPTVLETAALPAELFPCIDFSTSADPTADDTPQ